MSVESVAQSILLPELKYVKENWAKRVRYIECIKTSKFEVCAHCATKSSSIYDHRFTRPKDEPIRNKLVTLVIKKRRFKCQNKDCEKVFTEPVEGIRKGFRTTQSPWPKTIGIDDTHFKEMSLGIRESLSLFLSIVTTSE